MLNELSSGKTITASQPYAAVSQPIIQKELVESTSRVTEKPEPKKESFQEYKIEFIY